ncbi:hypothetical protein HKX48_001306 [Thoreauomyces humboldtii]|nr:hypothetical protein HKX48_001306 [Thoreauomyces humboldtii]
MVELHPTRLSYSHSYHAKLAKQQSASSGSSSSKDKRKAPVADEESERQLAKKSRTANVAVTSRLEDLLCDLLKETKKNNTNSARFTKEITGGLAKLENKIENLGHDMRT